MTALASDTSESIMQYSAIKVLVYYFFYMGSQVSIFLAEISIIGSFELPIVVFDALVVWAVLGPSSSVLFCVLLRTGAFVDIDPIIMDICICVYTYIYRCYDNENYY